MKLFKAKLVERIKRTRFVESFRFYSEEKVEFIPGQFLQLIFDEGNLSNKSLNKYLSFSSSPTKDYVEVTKKLSDSVFSHKLRDLKVGDYVVFKAPLGKCVFQDKYKRVVFLIGGIGITPVISIIEYIVDKGIDSEVDLFYANKTVEDIAFKRELDSWREQRTKVKVFYLVSQQSDLGKEYIYGRIDRDLILGKLNEFSGHVFFIFGPPAMVEHMQSICVDSGCNKEDIRVESFIGY